MEIRSNKVIWVLMLALVVLATISQALVVCEDGNLGQLCNGFDKTCCEPLVCSTRFTGVCIKPKPLCKKMGEQCTPLRVPCKGTSCLPQLPTCPSPCTPQITPPCKGKGCPPQRLPCRGKGCPLPPCPFPCAPEITPCCEPFSCLNGRCMFIST